MSAHEPIPFLNLSAEYKALEQEWFEQIRMTGGSGRYILGPQVAEFENEFAAACGAGFSVAVANGTDALLLSMRALGIGPGDEVITTPYTFFATAEAISHTGAKPVFADIDENTFCINPDHVASRITPKSKAILPVHLFGCAADMTALNTIAADNGLAVVEDAAQAFGARVGGSRVGALGDVGCFSFYPTKVLGCYGDGGIISMANEIHVAALQKLRNHGASAPFMHDQLGYNSRLDEIQAALLRIKLRKVDQDIAARQAIADRYRQGLQATDVRLAQAPAYGTHVYNLFTIASARRDAIRKALQANQIPHSQCYPLPLHLQQVYAELHYKAGDLPVSEKASMETLSLPVYPAMPHAHVDRICEIIRSALG